MPNLYITGAGLLIIVLVAFFIYGYDNHRKRVSKYSYDDFKSRYTVISEPAVYDFMNYTLFKADTAFANRREFIKLNCFSIKHSSDLKKFINSQSSTILSFQDKKQLKSQIDKQTFLWDQSKLINVWCLTPKDLYQAGENETIDYWVNFRQLFGNYGHHHYSKPIFNKDKTVVVIKHSGQGDWLWGSSEILLFKKENGKWKIN